MREGWVRSRPEFNRSNMYHRAQNRMSWAETASRGLRRNRHEQVSFRFLGILVRCVKNVIVLDIGLLSGTKCSHDLKRISVVPFFRLTCPAANDIHIAHVEGERIYTHTTRVTLEHPLTILHHPGY